MRATLVSLTAFSLAASAAFAQTMPEPAAPAASAPTPAPMPMPAPAPATANSAAPPSVSYSTAPMPAPAMPTPTPAMPAPPAPATSGAMAPTTAPATDTTMAAAPPAPVPATPPAPPPAPTDPAAVALISTLESVCIPAVAGGTLDKLTRTVGYHKSGDNYVLNGKGFKLTVLAPGANPKTCHVDIVSGIDAEGPAKPIVVALHNWAAVARGYTLYRNDKNVTGAQELTTRSWELGDGGKNQAVVLTTFRKADGTPSNGRETSQMLFSTTATSAG